MDFHYQHPVFFIILVAIPLAGLLFWTVLRWKSRVIQKIGDPRLVARLTGNFSPPAFLAKFLLLIAAFTAVILAIADPVRTGTMDRVERKGVDVMIALDVSNSMLAEDIPPNRLERAKQVVNGLISRLDNNRVGLVLFAGRAYMQMPLTIDHSAARILVQNAAPDIVPTQGTMLSEALKLSASAFNSRERKYKSIVLITDGEDHDPASLEIARELANYGVMINTVGIGSSIGTPIPDPATGKYRKDSEGNTVLSKLNEAQLQQLASLTRGIYVGPDQLGDAESVILKQLSEIETTAIEDLAFKDYIHYFPWLVAAALLLLVLEFLLPERKLKFA